MRLGDQDFADNSEIDATVEPVRSGHRVCVIALGYSFDGISFGSLPKLLNHNSLDVDPCRGRTTRTVVPLPSSLVMSIMPW